MTIDATPENHAGTESIDADCSGACEGEYFDGRPVCSTHRPDLVDDRCDAPGCLRCACLNALAVSP